MKYFKEVLRWGILLSLLVGVGALLIGGLSLLIGDSYILGAVIGGTVGGLYIPLVILGGMRTMYAWLYTIDTTTRNE